MRTTWVWMTAAGFLATGCTGKIIGANNGDDRYPADPDRVPDLDRVSDEDRRTDQDPPTDQDLLAALNWDDSRPFRQTITLEPHPDRDRVDLPVLAVIEHPGAYVLRDVAVFETTGGMTPEAIAAAAWCEPDGHITQVGFNAPGTTAVGQARQFAVYYSTAPSPEPWQWSDVGWATRQELPGGLIGVSGGCCAIQREVDESAGTLRGGRRSGQATGLTLLGPSWKVAEGFSNGYQLQSGETVYPTRSLESEVYTGLAHDGDAAQAAFATSWGADASVAHTASVTQRVFADWPFAQYVLAVTSDVNPLGFSSNAWSARQVFLTDTYDRMVSDVYADAALVSEWNTGMRWFVAYDSSSDRGFGWFMSHPGVVRANNDAGPSVVFDSYAYSAGSTRRFRALWMASEDKDEIVDLFDAMKPGVRVSVPESRDLNIVTPADGSFWFPDDTLQVTVSTPGSSSPVSASWTFPDTTGIPVVLARVGDTWIWEATSPMLLTTSHPEGTWVLTVHSAGQTRQALIQVRHPDHPHLFFDTADLVELRARRDSTHADIWAAMLAEASGYGAPIDNPGVGIDIRSYAGRLTNLALIQLIDPSAPYDAVLWSYFFAMLRYPNWTDSDNPFNNWDLTVGHFLMALSVTYDWHYDRLTPEERREVRARLADMADVWIGTSYMRHYPAIDWTHYGTVTNNHYWINQGGVAASAFVLEDEVPDARRQPWEDRTEANLAVILSVLEDDGASNEGVAYHSYGQINLFPWVDMRDRALGGQTATSSPWFENSILWDLYSITPGGTDNYGGPANFGDCPPYHYNPPRTIQSWLAARLGNGVAQWTAEELEWPRQTAYSYLWYDPTVVAIAPDTLPTWHLAANRGVFAWRSSWQNDATYFSLKSGSTFGGHEQPDAGHFILHRAGVPYVTDLGYSYLKMTDEHNLILVDGAGQYGEAQQWMAAVDPVHWASVPFVLGDARYFDVLAHPGAMVESTDLMAWEREVVGLGPDIFLVRDVMAAGTSVPFTWLLHSYRSNPPTSTNQSYDTRTRRLENAWSDLGGGRWQLHPQDAAPDLYVADCSADAWTAVIEPTLYVPEQKLDVGGYNHDFESFQLGHRLRRSRTAAATSSLVAAWFGDDVSVEALTGSAEGARLYDSNTDIAWVLWPGAATATVQGLTVTGTMGGRRLDDPAVFGREITHVEKDAQVLVHASAAVSLYARTEHTGTASDPRFATVQSSGGATLELFCPVQPTQVELDGSSVAFTWSNSMVTVDVPAGAHRLVLN